MKDYTPLPERGERPIGEWLNMIGNAYRDRREHVASRARKEEFEQFQGPRINPSSEVVLPFEDRCQNAIAKKTQIMKRHEEVKREKEDEELEECVFRPTITARASRRSRSDQGEISRQFIASREAGVAKRHDEETKKLAEEMSQFAAGSKSRYLADQNADRKAMNLSDWLMFSTKTREVKKWFQLQQSAHAHRPRITKFAETLSREGPVGERLYGLAVRGRFENDCALLADIHEQEGRESRRRHSYSASAFRPQINPNSREIAGRLGTTAQERLLTAPPRSPTKHTEVDLTEEHTFKPVINEVSRALAEGLPSTTEDRILKPRTREELAPSPQTPRGVQTLASKAVQYVANLPAHERQKIVEAKSMLAKQRLMRQAEERQELLMKECTFRPKTRSLSEGPAMAVGASVVERVSQWDHRRQERIRGENEKKRRLDEKDCTFHPNVNGIRGEWEGWSVRSKTGVEEFLERQGRGRAMRERQGAGRPFERGPGVAVVTSPHKWTPKVTIPVDFSFQLRGSPKGKQNSSPHSRTASSISAQNGTVGNVPSPVNTVNCNSDAATQATTSPLSPVNTPAGTLFFQPVTLPNGAQGLALIPTPSFTSSIAVLAGSSLPRSSTEVALEPIYGSAHSELSTPNPELVHQHAHVLSLQSQQSQPQFFVNQSLLQPQVIQHEQLPQQTPQIVVSSTYTTPPTTPPSPNRGSPSRSDHVSTPLIFYDGSGAQRIINIGTSITAVPRIGRRSPTPQPEPAPGPTPQFFAQNEHSVLRVGGLGAPVPAAPTAAPQSVRVAAHPLPPSAASSPRLGRGPAPLLRGPAGVLHPEYVHTAEGHMNGENLRDCIQEPSDDMVTGDEGGGSEGGMGALAAPGRKASPPPRGKSSNTWTPYAE